MPASIIGMVVGELVAAAVVETVMLPLVASTVISGVVGFATSTVLRGAFSGSEGGGTQDSAAAAVADPIVTSKDRLISVRQPVAPWDVVYGRVRKGGVITYMESSSDHVYLHLIVTLAGHVCDAVETVYLNDEALTLDGSGWAQGRFLKGDGTSYARVQISLGAEAGQPFSDLVSESGGLWTDAHRQTGHTKIYLRLEASPDIFPSGLPAITAIVRGKKVSDPRYSPAVTAYSNNAALCLLDYLTDTEYGIGATYATEIDDTQAVSAINSCAEAVALAAGGTESRYTANGTFNVDAEPQRVLELMLASMSGKLVNIGGRWHLYAGVYDAPTLSLSDDDLAGGMRIQSLVSRRDNANGAKGTFTDPNSSWQPTDFPPVASNQYKTEDGGERVWRDMDLSPFVTSGTQAQRLAKIELLRTRQGLTIIAPFKLKAFRAATGRTISYTSSHLGLSSKAFEVGESRFIFAEDGSLAVELSMRETASSIFDWSTNDESPVDAAPNSNLPDPFAGLTISGLTATSGTADLFVNGDGTVVPRVRLRWTSLTNPYIKNYEIQFSRLDQSPTSWEDAPTVAAPATEAFALPVEDGVIYDLRIRAVSLLGNRGDWAYVRSHTVVGKTELPSDVSGASAVQSGGLVVMGCNAVADADLDAIEVRLQDAGNTTWADGTPVANILRGQTVTSAALPPGTFNLLFKARDTSGNYSANAAVVEIIVTSEGYSAITNVEQSTAWLGTRSNMVKHYTGVLTPDSEEIAAIHLSCPGTSGNVARASDGVRANLTGFDIRVRALVSAYPAAAQGNLSCLMSKFTGPNGTFSFRFSINNAGSLNLGLTQSGYYAGSPNEFNESGSVTAIPLDGKVRYYRATYRQSDRRVQYFLSDDGRAWTQLGSDKTFSFVGSIHWGAENIEIGSDQQASIEALIGRVYSAEVRSAIDGPVIVSFNPEEDGASNGSTSVVSSSGHTWSIIQSGASPASIDGLGWEVFNEFVPNAYTDCYYTAPVIDKGIDANARIYGDIVSRLGPGETSGVAAPELQVDYRLSTGSFDGYEVWTVGMANFRYLLARIHVDTTIGKPVIEGFNPTIDGLSRDESGTLTVGAGGSGSVTFATPFHSTPVLNVSPQGSGNVSASYDGLSSTGFTGYFKSGGAAAAGTLSYTAIGA